MQWYIEVPQVLNVSLLDFNFRINLMARKVLKRAKVLTCQGWAALVRNSRYAAEMGKL